LIDARSILKEYWGYEAFRPLQEEIIHSVVSKKDTVALLPTGGGKSICFQVPAMMQDGICLVVSPLIALMRDQVENLKKKGILATAIYSGMSKRMIVQALKNAAYGPYKFLYVSPERLETAIFKEYLPALPINLVAIDEAHCISQWGYDFRPSYLNISNLREELKDVPFLAVTASATPEVQKDICDKLKLQEPAVFSQSFERKNLSYSVYKEDAKLTRLVDIIKKVPGTAIVYCRSRKRTVEIAHLLKMHGISADHYHAGLMQEERTARQTQWIAGDTRVIVSTNAFGMGIDKPDVRLVVHADLPDCLENYYQEAGRAGRDEKKAYAVLLYSFADIEDLHEQHLTRFPTIETIRKVYDALCNFLQIPLHGGEEISYDFSFSDFIRNFKLNSFETIYALKALEQDGWLTINEKSFISPTVVFNVSKEQLYAFQNSHPAYESLLSVLLRTYEGIFDYPAFISERSVASSLGTTIDEVKKQLSEVHRFGVIRYEVQNENPQVWFGKRRVSANDLVIDLRMYEKRKAAFITRVKQMTGYTKAEECRAVYINQYFGDDSKKQCGICDNCLKKKAGSLTSVEFGVISDKIQLKLKERPLQANELVSALGVNKEKAWKVMRFLEQENKIEVKIDGTVSWK
jgi:ATP-dependent DNA helicase RecQ